MPMQKFIQTTELLPYDGTNETEIVSALEGFFAGSGAIVTSSMNGNVLTLNATGAVAFETIVLHPGDFLTGTAGMSAAQAAAQYVPLADVQNLG